MFCQECPKRDRCRKICPNLEKHLAKSYVSQRETPHAPKGLSGNLNIPLDNLHVGISRKYRSDDENLKGERNAWASFASFFTSTGVRFPFLTRLQNEMLYLFHYRNYSYREIARALSGGPYNRKVNHHVVKGQLTRARTKIRNLSSKKKRAETTSPST